MHCDLFDIRKKGEYNGGIFERQRPVHEKLLLRKTFSVRPDVEQTLNARNESALAFAKIIIERQRRLSCYRTREAFYLLIMNDE